jgi:hypothetical protein
LGATKRIRMLMPRELANWLLFSRLKLKNSPDQKTAPILPEEIVKGGFQFHKLSTDRIGENPRLSAALQLFVSKVFTLWDLQEFM